MHNGTDKITARGENIKFYASAAEEAQKFRKNIAYLFICFQALKLFNLMQ